MPTVAWRRARLSAARLYLVIEADAARSVVPSALLGGVDVVQLREKSLGDDEIVRVGRWLRSACDAHGALLVVNDRPDLAVACGADGVHLGQSDASPATVDDELLVGLSTHSPAQIYAASRVDYL